MRVASFFSGCGGMDLGFIQAGHEIVFACDFDKYCKQTYDANFSTPLTLLDFNQIKPEDIPEADIFIGGPPCQDFSIAGKGAGIEGERGSLINKYVDLIGIKKPKWVVIENVKGLLSKRHRPAFDALCEKLCSYGYVVTWKILNSKDFGVPQNRNRIFIVAGPHEFIFPEGEELDKCLADVVDDTVDEKYYLSNKAEVKLRDVKKKTEDDIASTVTAGYYKMGWRGNYIKTPHKTGLYATPRIRRLTPRECARLQGFPENFIFTVSDTQIYKQCGNAVTVNVAEAIGNVMKEQEEEKQAEENWGELLKFIFDNIKKDKK